MHSFLGLAVLASALGYASASTTELKLAHGGALDMLHNQHHEISANDTAAAGNLDLPQSTLRPVQVHVHNLVGKPLQAVVVTSAGSPSLGSSQIVYDSATFTVPEHAAGQITFGHNTDPRGSKVEFSNGFQVDATQIFMDVSYVDGFSVPIKCRCGGVKTGCSKPLFQRHRCPNPAPGPLCVNNSPENGPPGLFFTPCRAEAFTFAYQGGSGTGTYCQGDQIDCCIGAACGNHRR